jgi:hypothetical protein
MSVDFRRIKRRLPRWVRNRVAFFSGAFYAAGQLAQGKLQGLSEHVKAEATKLNEDIKAITESDDRVIFVLVGQAITAWAKLEEALVFLFTVLLRTEPEKAGLILYSTINFSVWISMIDELFAADDLFSALKPRWNKMASRLRAVKDERDRIAHHGIDIDKQSSRLLSEITIRPSPLDTRQKSKKFKPMDNDDIINFTVVVAGLAQQIADLSLEMARTLQALQKKSSE